MTNKSHFLLLLFIALLVSGCLPSESDPKPASTSEETVNINIGKVIRSGEFEQRAEIEILPQNNCDNKSPISFSVGRERTLEQSVDLTLQGELGGELGAEMLGKIVATIGAEYGQSSRKSISDSGGMEFTIEAGDFPNYTIVWREKWEKGYITVQYDDKEIEIPYLYLATARPELVNVEYESCETGRHAQPTSIVATKDTNTPIPLINTPISSTPVSSPEQVKLSAINQDCQSHISGYCGILVSVEWQDIIPNNGYYVYAIGHGYDDLWWVAGTGIPINQSSGQSLITDGAYGRRGENLSAFACITYDVYDLGKENPIEFNSKPQCDVYSVEIPINPK